MVLIYKSLDVCDMIVVDHKDRIFETVRSAYYHKHGDVRLCTVMVSSMAFEAGISMELEVSNG